LIDRCRDLSQQWSPHFFSRRPPFQVLSSCPFPALIPFSGVSCSSLLVLFLKICRNDLLQNVQPPPFSVYVAQLYRFPLHLDPLPRFGLHELSFFPPSPLLYLSPSHQPTTRRSVFAPEYLFLFFGLLNPLLTGMRSRCGHQNNFIARCGKAKPSYWQQLFYSVEFWILPPAPFSFCLGPSECFPPTASSALIPVRTLGRYPFMSPYR